MKSVDNSGNKFGDNLKSYPEFILDYPLRNRTAIVPLLPAKFAGWQNFRLVKLLLAIAILQDLRSAPEPPTNKGNSKFFQKGRKRKTDL